MNNGEYIRQIPNDKLAVFLESLRGCPPPLYNYACPEEMGEECPTYLCPTYLQCKECWEKWLNEEYRGRKSGNDI